MVSITGVSGVLLLNMGHFSNPMPPTHTTPNSSSDVWGGCVHSAYFLGYHYCEDLICIAESC